MTAALAPTAADQHVCGEASCRFAVSPISLCECSCGGVGHGVDRGFNHRLVPAPRPATAAVKAARLRDVFAATSADDAF